MKKFDLTLYAITPNYDGENYYEKIDSCLKGGATILQLREKNLKGEKLFELAQKVKKLTDKYGVDLIINDDIELCNKIDASGVHLGQSDLVENIREKLGRDKILGISVRDEKEAKDAIKMGCDYFGVGAVFNTSTKLDAKVVEMDMLKKLAEFGVPVVAIGGINFQNIGRLRNTGISGVALISDIFSAEDIEEKTRVLKIKIEHILNNTLPKVLSIAGTDPSGGAGIEADLKTFISNGVYGMAVIAAQTAQNTMGVLGIEESSIPFLEKQIEGVFKDIFPDAVKIGMAFSERLVEKITEELLKYGAKNIVVDPVMVATSGSKLLSDGAIEVMKKRLIPISTLITPNVLEAEELSGEKINNREDMEKVGRLLNEEFGVNVLVKGGHAINDANDLLVTNEKALWFNGSRIKNENTHGTGCTLSSAVASYLAQGFSLESSIKLAKEYLEMALRDMLNLGHGRGPMNHGYKITSNF